MFAENRVHQRTSGRPYPNKVVMQVDRKEKIQKEYTAVRLENEYLEVVILPEIGGRIYSARDKITGYDFFYKQHVIKPALIGVLGSWISGGVEFNWPFHHRASGFMPCDYTLSEEPDGSAVCWLSEHDPIDRMKGMFGIVLRPGCSYLETRMQLYNRTDSPHSFLWWENAAVPVNEDYQIFFPPDVSYVSFHYLKSHISYPIAGNGVFNGISMQQARDISLHKNTRDATSYFAAASQFDFFGGYDHGKCCGVVHIGDRHISPGKKMFTWGYGQLSTSWQNALTDTDGPYAELMAGSYSDNQPNFSWLDAYETKQFSQYWYPISCIGTPCFANLNCALRLEKTQGKVICHLQTTQSCPNARITLLSKSGKASWQADLDPSMPQSFSAQGLTGKLQVTVSCGQRLLAEYTEKDSREQEIPECIPDMPTAGGMTDPEELYLAGLHVQQYRDPAVEPDAYWLEALKRDPYHAPSLLGMAEYSLRRFDFVSAKAYAEKAIARLCRFNTRLKSGEAYYIYAKTAEAVGEADTAYDYYHKAAWSADCVAKAMTRLAVLDIRRGAYGTAVQHADTALQASTMNGLAMAAKAIALLKLNRQQEAAEVLNRALRDDPLNQLSRYLAGVPDFYETLYSCGAQTCLDLAADLDAMGQYGMILSLLNGLCEHRSEQAVKPVYYAIAYYRALLGLDTAAAYAKAQTALPGKSYPIRLTEVKALEAAITRTDDWQPKMLLGCLWYHKRQYAKALALWECAGNDYTVLRNKAVAYFSHFEKGSEALALMKQALAQRDNDQQLLYETVVLMDKMGISPTEKLALLQSHLFTRDDLYTELAKAYNQNRQHQQAIDTLLHHTFTPCEGGEHTIADQYLVAHLFLGQQQLEKGQYAAALELFRAGQALPQNLGAGIWNRCKLVPLRYHQAICLRKLGQEPQAEKIFRDILNIRVDYFSNMHLKELPFYQALAANAVGEPLLARSVMSTALQQWVQLQNGTDNGFFTTTPFFISFTDNPAKLRKALSLYLIGLSKLYAGETEIARSMLAESYALNSDNLFALFFAGWAKSE